MRGGVWRASVSRSTVIERSSVAQGTSGARALVIGAGGLGCPAALALARSGVGSLTLADDDDVDLSNLHRQILYGERDVGRAKVECAARSLERLSAGVIVEQRPERIVPENARELVRGFDVVLEGSDNFATKFLTADACALERVPVVHGAGIRWIGTALAVGAAGAPCYRCVFEDVPEGAQAGCNDAGVMGPVVGIVGAIMADLALSLLSGAAVAGTLVTFDGKTGVRRARSIAARRACPLCGDEKVITDVSALRYERSAESRAIGAPSR